MCYKKIASFNLQNNTMKQELSLGNQVRGPSLLGLPGFESWPHRLKPLPDPFSLLAKL